MDMPHDRIAKIVFGDPPRARELLHLALPSSVLGTLDLDALALDSSSFIGSKHEERLSDIVLRTRTTTGDDVLVQIVLEHMSQATWRLPLVVLGRVVRALESVARNLEAGDRLPVVIPVAVVHDSASCQSVKSLCEITACNHQLWTHLGEHRVRLNVFVFDLAVVPDHVLAKVVNDALALTLSLFKHARTHPEIHRLFRSMGARLQRLRSPLGDDLFTGLFEYTVEVNPHADPHELAEEIARIDRDKGGIAMSKADEIRQKWKLEGRLEGQLEGQRALLRGLIETRFGPIPTWALDRLETASLENITRWSQAVLASDSIESLFEG